jgi:signal transduction histidine kinase
LNTEKLLREIIESYPNLQRPDIRIEIARPLPVVRANPAALTQVFSNLLGNAVKFVSPDIPPRIKIHAEPATADDGRVRFWFEDNGIGIEPGSAERIFQMFQRLNRAELFEGTGVGLAIVRKAVERMGGSVGVESEAGHGSRFWVELKTK